MKKLIVALAIATLLVGCASAQVNIPLTGSAPTTKKTKPTSKMLTGTVTDKNDEPIPGAVVYLKNTKTLAVKSFFTQQDGSYRFPELGLNTDYEVYAEKDGKKSATKTVSQFDDRFTPTINLRIDLNK
jgi:predicted component of type VI protein secretion system